MAGTKRRAFFGTGFRGIVVAAAALSFATMSVGCRVAESDVKRWERTQHGPYKLVAVVTHDKYSWDLRTEAALSLIRMPSREGVRLGIDFLIEKYKDEDGQTREGALNQISDEARRHIVDAMAPTLIEQLQPPPPAHTPDGRLPPDPSIPYKDAAFAMLIHEPPLVSNEQTRDQLKAALTHWAQTGFDDRIETGAQQFGLEQMMRYLGPESVKTLPGIINENTARLDRISSLVNDVGDDATKLKTSEALVALAKQYHSKEWLDEQTKLVKASNAKNDIKANESQVAGQVNKIQDRRLTQEVFPAMKRVGGRPSIDYLFQYAGDKDMPAERRKLALAALEGRVDKNNPRDLDRLLAIAKSDDTPDAVRDGAFARLGELPKEQIVPKLWAFFNAKNWKVRWVAASLVLKTIDTKQVPTFMAHLPKTSATKMGMTEPLSYAELIGKMETTSGQPTPRDVLKRYLTSKDLGPKLTALGYFWDGKKADQGLVAPFADDDDPLPKCEKEDACSWQCDVAKAPGSKETEPRELSTVGDFVKLCLVPSMTK